MEYSESVGGWEFEAEFYFGEMVSFLFLFLFLFFFSLFSLTCYFFDFFFSLFDILPDELIPFATLRYERRANGYRLTCDACRSMYGIECGRRLKKTFKIAEEMAGMITSAGFVDVVEKRFKWPIGPWSSDPRLKEIGRWNLLNWEEGMEGWVIAPYTRVLGVSEFSFSFLISLVGLSHGHQANGRGVYVQWSAADVQEWLAEIRKALRDRKKHVYHEV